MGDERPPQARGLFAERFALLYAEAGEPQLKRVSDSVARARRVDERGRPVQVPAQRISDWRRGRNVPARFGALSAVLEVLIGEARKNRSEPVLAGLYDLDAWQSWWRAALDSPVAGDVADHDEENPPQPEAGADTGVCPYRGLASFRAEDAAWFHGRERSVTALVARVEDALHAGGFTVLAGASGAGKSSLLHAGLLPALDGETLGVDSAQCGPVVRLTPGADPLQALEQRVPDLAGVLDRRSDDSVDTAAIHNAMSDYAEQHAGPRTRPVFVVDQFEEVFISCGDDEARRTFVRVLHAACTLLEDEDVAPAAVVLGVRADFYGWCLDYPELAAAVQERQLVLSAMGTGELRSVITQPARAAGVRVEPGLVELMLRDLGADLGRLAPRRAYDAGALPLLSHALLATWQRRQAGRLTIAGYRAAGGIHGAVAATAERAWADLDAAGQAAARQVLLRLVHVGADSRDTRRRASRSELIEQAGSAAGAEEALDVLARSRLITLHSGSVEISHEALLHAWPRLRGWIDADRAGNLARQRLESDAATWDTEGRDSSLLYRGARLETALSAAAEGCSTYARQFLDASVRHRRRAVRRRRFAGATVTAFALIAAIAAVVAIRERDIAEFGQVLAQADRLEGVNPSLSAQLDLVADQMRPDDPGARSRLLSTQARPLAAPLAGHGGEVYLTSFSPDGRTLATADYDNTVRLWDTSDRTHPRPLGPPLRGHDGWVSTALFSPDGRTLVSGGDDGTVRLWDVADPAHPRRLGPPMRAGGGTVYLVDFSPDGRTIATANEDGTVRLWDVADRAHPTQAAVLRGHRGQVRSVAFSPDGRTLASTGDDGTVRLWDVSNRRHVSALAPPLTGHTAGGHSVTFSPDGRTLASASVDKTVRLWDVSDRWHPAPLGVPITGHNAPVWSVKFSPDGRTLASGSEDGTARLWNVTDPQRVSEIGGPLGAGGTVYAVGFSPDGRSLATGSGDNLVRLWSLPPVLTGHTAAVNRARLRPDGQILVTASGDQTMRVWDTTDPSKPRELGGPVHAHDGPVYDARFRPDGRVLATSGGDQRVRLWDMRDPAHPVQLGQIRTDTRYQGALAFSPDGTVLAAPVNDTTTQLWDVRDPAHPHPLGAPLVGHTGWVMKVAFTPDGNTLVSAGGDRTVRLWDVSDRNHPRPLGHPLTGGAVRTIAVSPRGHVLAVGGADKTVQLWDIADPAHPRPVSAPVAGHRAALKAAEFSPDGRTLATGSEDKSVQLWDVSDPSDPRPLPRALQGQHGYVNSVSFGPHGHTLATASHDNTARLWNLDPRAAAARICADTPGVLTPRAWHEQLPQMSYDPPCPR